MSEGIVVVVKSWVGLAAVIFKNLANRVSSLSAGFVLVGRSLGFGIKFSV